MRDRAAPKGLAKLAATLLAALAQALQAADERPSPAVETVVQFHTVCSSCHEGECSGRLSFDSGTTAARTHIERYLGTTNGIQAAALFDMLRHIKETCSHYPAVPNRPAVGVWEADELAPWRNARVGAYFIPLGQLVAGRRQLRLEFDGAVEGNARIDNERMEAVADEQLGGDAAKNIGFDAAANILYFLHLKAGPGILRRIVFH